jgi:hypothetical protein
VEEEDATTGHLQPAISCPAMEIAVKESGDTIFLML